VLTKVSNFNDYTLNMTRILDKFTKNVKKLDNYYVLREESTHLVLGTMVNIKKHHEVLNNVFQPYSHNINVNIYVAFVIPLTDDFPELKEFKEKKIPILFLPMNLLNGKDETDPIKECLDHFIDKKVINTTS
jgi:hypothetical protein